MNFVEKEAAVKNISEAFDGAPASFLIDYKGCSCEELGDLRSKLRDKGASLAVVKNTLAKRAISETDIESLSEHFNGPTAVVWAGEDPVGPAKVLTEFAKDVESLSLKAGSLEGKAVTSKEIEDLSKLPSKEELFAKLLGLLIAPATRLAQTMNAPATQLARLLDIRRQELESGEGESKE